MAETRARDGREALARAVWARLVAHGLLVDEVRLVPPGTLARTTSGKLVRTRIRALAAE